MRNRCLVLKGLSQWQLGYFAATFEKKFGKGNFRFYEFDKETNQMIVEINKELSVIDEFKLIRACRKLNADYYFGTIKA